MTNWHVWTINQQKYKKGKIAEFLEALVDVEDFVYPVVEQEYNTTKGKKTKNVPVYSNYIFIQHHYNGEILTRIQKCRWIKYYVGLCSTDEIRDVKKLNGQHYEDVMPNKYGLTTGMVILLNNGFTCTIKSILGEDMTVHTTVFGKDIIFDCTVDDIKKDV